MFTHVNAKQEQFLWLVVDGMAGSRAYAEVYGQDKSKAVCEANASRLLSTAKVRARRQEIIAARAARQPVTAQFLTTELIAIAGESRALGQGSAAVAAMMGVAKLQGLLIDKVDLNAVVRKPSESPESPAEMSEAEWASAFGVVLDLEPLQPEVSLPAPDTQETVAADASPDEDTVEEQ